MQDAFGTVPIVLVKRAAVLVPSGMINLSPLPPAPPQAVPSAPPALTVDHYLCYKAKAPSFKPVRAVNVSDALVPSGYQNAGLVKLTRFCTPADLDGGDPAAPSHLAHLACYQMKLFGAKIPKTVVSTNNAHLGAQVLKVAATGELCLPANVVP
jgi:hypothetical protein